MALTKIQMSELLLIYANMLTDKQRDALLMYCDCDCSLSEIADEVGISRQGVRDAIVKGEATLIKLEEALHLSAFYKKLSLAVESGDKDSVFQIVEAFVSKE